MKRAIGVLLFLVVLATSAFGQIGGGASITDRLYFGGGGGFGGGTSAGVRYTYFSVVPIIGYKVTDQFSVGTGITYQRYNYPDFHYTRVQYGASPFLRYNFDQLFLQTEYNYINAPNFDNTRRAYYNRLLIGAGYRAPIGQRSAINAMALYDVLYKQPSVFASPWVFRVFFTF